MEWIKKNLKFSVFNYLNFIFIILMPILLYYFYKSTIIYVLFMFSIYRVYKLNITTKLKIMVLVFDMAVVIPIALYPNSHFIGIATQICIYGILAIGLNIVVGFAGL